MLYYTKLRYRLMPYIYSIVGKTHFDDYTIMRALVMDFGNDKQTHSISDQYMFGPGFMVCPVYAYKATSRNVYFPENSNWYDFETNTYIKGGQNIEIAAPYERMPLFVKEGSIVPMGRDIQHTKEVQSDNITLRVYTGKDAQFTLYEDDGTNYDYEKGLYASINICYNEESKRLDIGSIEGNFPELLRSRIFNVEWITPDGKKHPISTINYRGKASYVTITN